MASNATKASKVFATTGDYDTTSNDIHVATRYFGCGAFKARCTARGRFLGIEPPFFFNCSQIALSRSFALSPFGIPRGQSCLIASRIPRVFAPTGAAFHEAFVLARSTHPG